MNFSRNFWQKVKFVLLNQCHQFRSWTLFLSRRFIHLESVAYSLVPILNRFCTFSTPNCSNVTQVFRPNLVPLEPRIEIVILHRIKIQYSELKTKRILIFWFLALKNCLCKLILSILNNKLICQIWFLERTKWKNRMVLYKYQKNLRGTYDTKKTHLIQSW